MSVGSPRDYTFCAKSPDLGNCERNVNEADMSSDTNWKSIGELARKLVENAEKARK